MQRKGYVDYLNSIQVNELADAKRTITLPVYILQNAATSSVGRLLTQVALDRGVRPIRLVRSNQSAERLRSALPGPPIYSTSDSNWKEQVREALGGHKLEVAFDAMGGNPRVVAGDDMSRPNSAYLVETNPSTHLKWSTFVTPSIPVVTTDFAPGEQERPWPPTSSTLIYGLRDAVLVDSFITLEQACALEPTIPTHDSHVSHVFSRTSAATWSHLSC